MGSVVVVVVDSVVVVVVVVGGVVVVVVVVAVDDSVAAGDVIDTLDGSLTFSEILATVGPSTNRKILQLTSR